MVKYKCPRCGYKTERKTDIKKHCSRKTLCNPTIKKVTLENFLKSIDIKPKIICKYCNKEFKKNSNLKYHLNICKKKDKLKKQHEELKRQHEKIQNIKIDIFNELKEKFEKEKIRKYKEGENGFIYLLREREFIRMKEDIYKLGKTNNTGSKMGKYPKGSQVYMSIPVKNLDNKEKSLLRIFNKFFKQRIDLGLGYFEGDLFDMITIIHNEIII